MTESRGVGQERAAEAIEQRAEAVRRRQTERALRRLRERRAVEPEEAAAIRALADRLTERLIAGPTVALRDAEPSEAAVALALFDAD